MDASVKFNQDTEMSYSGNSSLKVEIQGEGLTINGKSVSSGIHTLVAGDVVQCESLEAEPLVIIERPEQ